MRPLPPDNKRHCLPNVLKNVHLVAVWRHSGTCDCGLRGFKKSLCHNFKSDERNIPTFNSKITTSWQTALERWQLWEINALKENQTRMGCDACRTRTFCSTNTQRRTCINHSIYAMKQTQRAAPSHEDKATQIRSAHVCCVHWGEIWLPSNWEQIKAAAFAAPPPPFQHTQPLKIPFERKAFYSNEHGNGLFGWRYCIFAPL